MVYRPRQSVKGNPRFAREEAPPLDSSKTALVAALKDPNLRLQPLKPLAVSVPTAATLLGIGTTTMWSLLLAGSESGLDVIRIHRRTLVTLASLERFVAETSASSRQETEDTP
jgi:hypothetical protein